MYISRIIAATMIALSAPLAFAADDIGEGINEKAIDTVIGLSEAGIVNTGYNFLYSKPVPNTGVLGATRLDDATIAKVLSKVENSLFPTLGFRELGGARVVIKTDMAQVANVAGLRNIEAALAARQVALPAGAPLTAAEIKAATQALVTELSPAQFQPKFKTTVINVRTANLASDLAALKNAGALVQEIQVKTTIPRLGGYAVAAFNIVLVGGAALDAYTASTLAYQSQYPEAGAAWKYLNCEQDATVQGGEPVYSNCAIEPNLVKQLLQNTPFALITAVMPN